MNTAIKEIVSYIPIFLHRFFTSEYVVVLRFTPSHPKTILKELK